MLQLKILKSCLFLSSSRYFWDLLIQTAIWLTLSEPLIPKSVYVLEESTMTWMTWERMFTTTHSLRCLEIGPLGTISKYI